MKSVNEIATFIKESVKELKEGRATNCRLKLDDRLAIFVGWSAGYGDEVRNDVVQDLDDLDFAINVGIKVWTSDDMWTDFDFLNYPYYKNGDVLDMGISIEPNDEADGYKVVAQDMVDYYNTVKTLDIDKDGEIQEHKEKKENKEAEESLKENLNNTPYKKIILEHFNYSGDFDFLEVVADVIDRIDNFKDEDDIREAIDSALIYCADQWEVLQFYCNPQDANWNDALELFNEDIYAICDKIAQKLTSEANDESEEE